MERLNEYLKEKINHLNGAWISKNSGYEKEACAELGFNCERKRYWDCEYDGLLIEMKKGKSIWLDEVRYCELFMRDITINEECTLPTITMFIIPSKDKTKIENIILVDTRKIIQCMNIDKEWAERLLRRTKEITRTLNCQQSMTLKDIKLIADYTLP